MKKKEMITLVVAVGVIAVSIYFILQLLFPKAPAEETNTESDNIPTVPTNIDEDTLKRVEDLSDYGKPDLTGIGKSDLFAGF